MRENYFWADDLAQSSLGVRITLSKEESHHLHHVLRVPIGEKIHLMDGRGCLAEGLVADHQKKTSEIEIKSLTQAKRGPQVHVKGPAPKGKRLAYLLEKLQELGVSSWCSLSCEHAVRNDLSVNERKKLNERLRAACKQSRNPWLMEMGPCVSYETLLKEDAGRVYVLDVEGDFIDSKKEEKLNGQEPILVVGPEAGFSERERELFINQGWQRLKLSSNHLRMETAAIVGSGRILEALSR